MKYSQPMLSSAAATRSATSSAVTTSVELAMTSRRVVRHVTEHPARALASVQPHRQANAELVVVCRWMARTDAGEGQLTDRLAEPHRRFEPLFRGQPPQQLVVARVRLRGGVDRRPTSRA